MSATLVLDEVSDLASSTLGIEAAGKGASTVSLVEQSAAPSEFAVQVDGTLLLFSSTALPFAVSGPIVTAPPDSHTATDTLGIVIGTGEQNTLGYDVLIQIAIPVTAAAGGSIVAGVGSSLTPTTDPVTPALAAATLITFSLVWPSSTYLLVDTSGTITVGTPVVLLTPL